MRACMSKCTVHSLFECRCFCVQYTISANCILFLIRLFFGITLWFDSDALLHALMHALNNNKRENINLNSTFFSSSAHFLHMWHISFVLENRAAISLEKFTRTVCLVIYLCVFVKMVWLCISQHRPKMTLPLIYFYTWRWSTYVACVRVCNW